MIKFFTPFKLFMAFMFLLIWTPAILWLWDSWSDHFRVAPRHLNGGEAGAAAPDVFLAEKGALVPRLRVTGVLEAVNRRTVRLQTEHPSPPWILSSILENGARVVEGETVATFEVGILARDEANLMEDIVMAESERALAADAEGLATDSDKLRVETAMEKERSAQQAWDSFELYDKGLGAGGLELDRRRLVLNLETEREEVRQLEKMYRDSQLDLDTKDIVLERAKAQLKNSEAGHDMALRKFERTELRDFPEQVRVLTLALARAKVEVRLAAMSRDIESRRREKDLKVREASLRRLKDNLARLQRDKGRLVIKAPFAGVIRHEGLIPGVPLQPGTPVFDIADPTSMRIRIPAPARERIALEAGAPFTARLQELPEITLEAVLESIGGGQVSAPDPSKDGLCPVWLGVRGLFTAARIGMRVEVAIHQEPVTGIVIPLPCVAVSGGRRQVTLKGPSGATEIREVVAGPDDGIHVLIVEGLAEGEAILKSPRAGG